MANIGSFAANSGSIAATSEEGSDDECIETKGKTFDAVLFHSFPRFFVVILLAVGRKVAPILLYYGFPVSSRFCCSRYLYFISFVLILLLRARGITRSVLSMSNFAGQNISSKDLGGNQNLEDARNVGSHESQKG